MQYLIIFVMTLLSTAAYTAELELAAGVNFYTQKIGSGGIDVADGDTGSGHILSMKIHSPHGDSQQHLLGAGVDIVDINGQQLLAFRAVDYQWVNSHDYRIGAFIGAASLDSGAAQTGYYLGGNISKPNIYKSLGLSWEIAISSGLGRDRLPTDPEGQRPDIFMDIYSSSLSLIYSF